MEGRGGYRPEGGIYRYQIIDIKNIYLKIKGEG